MKSHATGCLGQHDGRGDCYTSARGDTSPRPTEEDKQVERQIEDRDERDHEKWDRWADRF